MVVRQRRHFSWCFRGKSCGNVFTAADFNEIQTKCSQLASSSPRWERHTDSTYWCFTYTLSRRGSRYCCLCRTSKRHVWPLVCVPAGAKLRRDVPAVCWSSVQDVSRVLTVTLTVTLTVHLRTHHGTQAHRLLLHRRWVCLWLNSLLLPFCC